MLLDEIQDWTAANINPEKRDQAMERAMKKNLPFCEVCGRALKGESEIHEAGYGETVQIGPTCAKKLRKAGIYLP